MALEFAALHAALGLALQPNLVDRARKASLPEGVALLLEIVAGEEDAIRKSAEVTSVGEPQIRSAAEFYVEQILLSETSDCYRVLGAEKSATSASLRRNMALLMRWLHPDTAGHKSEAVQIDRTVFAERVSAAWETLKTDARRAAYDAEGGHRSMGPADGGRRVATANRHSPAKQSTRAKRKQLKPSRMRNSRARTKQRGASRKLKIVPRHKDSWLTRILNLFRRPR